MTRKISRAPLVLLVAVIVALGFGSLWSDRAAATSAHRVYVETSFAPVDLLSGERLYVNPALITLMAPRDAQRFVLLLTSDGKVYQVRGTLEEVKRTLRVDVWLEDDGPASPEGPFPPTPPPAFHGH